MWIYIGLWAPWEMITIPLLNAFYIRTLLVGLLLVWSVAVEVHTYVCALHSSCCSTTYHATSTRRGERGHDATSCHTCSDKFRPDHFTYGKQLQCPRPPVTSLRLSSQPPFWPSSQPHFCPRRAAGWIRLAHPNLDTGGPDDGSYGLVVLLGMSDPGNDLAFT